MFTVVVVIHLILAVALICIVLMQQSMGGGGMSGFMSGRSTANFLTRTTAALAAAFFATSITLAILAGSQRGSHSLINLPSSGPVSPAAPVQAPPASKAPAPGQVPASGGPSVPLAK
jgi:preprotein translocase subunit SecG